MKNLIAAIILFLSLPVSVLSDDQVTIKGTVYKKNGQWFIFVKSDRAFVRKGSLKLEGLNKTHDKYLKQKAYLKIIGKQYPCKSKNICIKVQSLSPAVTRPLKRDFTS